ncbi:heterokaryon incompatibility protein het-c [Zalerion maritima]|uniref:Heterokaryon incompatibility protein het-c n=1 Tax=Zalerion maritima TaxID=339359 RepID=A0AAD5RKA7_9PEZI|nr:heterokaryon incompatibility protein het-c [Zalerion maritima]
MISIKPNVLVVGLLVLFFFARPARAFGAGNIASISKIEGENWRHGDIEDALLRIVMARVAGGENFDKLMVSRVYFGNWLRDYSQAIDVGTVKSVSAEAVRLLLSILGFLTFGYGSREFEVTADRLGCYRPEEHIDNPKNYADNEDARQYDRRLRGPIDEGTELAVDPETGLKNYISNDRAGIMTSSKLLHSLLEKCIELGRRYNDSDNKADLYEALRLMGTGLHCLEDYFAHSNYTELALIEMGEEDIFPHVGRDTKIELDGREVYPIITGTFGGVDFLHSVTGEVSDKLEQNEIQELEGTLETSQSGDMSVLENILDMIPDGLFGDDDKKGKMHDIKDNAEHAEIEPVSPKEPEEYTLYIKQVFDQIMPAIEFHDDIIKAITKSIEKIPILPKVLDQLQEQLTMFVFSVIAPFVLPVIKQIRNELSTGSSEIIESSQRDQHIVFEDDSSSDPTHSMLSKDHFSNILNECAGKTASNMVHWVVPQLMEAWDDDGKDPSEVVDTIINGVFHHPAKRGEGSRASRKGRKIVFESVKDWWNNLDSSLQSQYREKLSRDGVENGDNHKEGIHDSGHGCGHPLKMKKFGKGNSEPETFEDKIAGQIAGSIMSGVTGGFASAVHGSTGVNVPTYDNPKVGDEQSGGLGGLVSKFGSAFGLGGGDDEPSQTRREHHSRERDDGGREETTTEYGRRGNTYEQTEYQEQQYGGGGGRTEYRQYEQREEGGRVEGFGYEERREYGGGNRGYDEGLAYGEPSYGERREPSGYGGGGHHGGQRRDDDNGFGYGGGGGGEEYGGRRDDDNGFGRGGDSDEYGQRRHHGGGGGGGGGSGWGY